ncbi:hypothetical protein DXT99_15630 [Pontibacter diazotrophicus]|uniref:Uncharacterized protein n=1 Tax=Pontibacter diazotrophicus TaxID=1400979 RepID=A0A3D8L9W9_9BACT|nr:hypothetical protein [Pontibacter diazotrophicus]RDV14221.1 hypothetical protein DXT99_15630 [Pontibacter diazotrophicus]
MCYYYTIKEYAAIKGLDLSAQDEAEAVTSATLLSNERGVPINKIYSGDSDMNCYATRILRETFRPSANTVNTHSEKTLAGASA